MAEIGVGAGFDPLALDTVERRLAALVGPVV
jgi:hypothetical protein